MRRRPSKSHIEVDSHRWVISFADFITLLFAFFVVMYSISSVNVSKYKSLSEGMKSAFNKKDLQKSTQSTAQINNGPEIRDTQGEHTDGMEQLKKSLSEIEDGSYKVKKQDGWIELDLKAGSLFETGTAIVKPEATLRLMKLAGKLRSLPYTIVVEGYTDNIPIETPQFPSNWELSAARAAAVGRVLNNFGVDANCILITGYGDQFPIADNSTEEGRQKNRRVNVLILRDRKVDRMFNPLIDQIHSSFIDDTDHVESAKPTQAEQDKKETK